MKILGVDPGLRITGYAVIEALPARIRQPHLIEAGVIRPSTTAKISQRLKVIHDELCELIRERKPEVMVIEKLYSDYRHPSTAILMGHARGVICLTSAVCGIPLASLPSTRVKKAVVSHGHASKDKVGRAVQAILGLKAVPKPPDVADALAVAIAFAWMMGKEPL